MNSVSILVRSVTHRFLVLAFIAALLSSCDDTSEVGLSVEGYVAGFSELDGRVHAVADKSLYHAMEIAVRNGEPSTFGYPYEIDPWFVLSDGDRVRLLELDEDEPIAQVEVLSGFHAGITCWVSLSCLLPD